MNSRIALSVKVVPNDTFKCGGESVRVLSTLQITDLVLDLITLMSCKL